MPYIQPSRSDVHVNKPLTNISIAYLQNQGNFVAGRVFPNIPVGKQSDVYYVYNQGDFNRDEMEERLPGTESAGSGFNISNETYYARNRAFHYDIPDQVRDNADSPINLDRDATEYVTMKGLINREVNWAATYFAAGAPGAIWTFSCDGAAARSAAFDPLSAGNNDLLFWNDASSTPIEDIRLLKRYIMEATGFMPNALTLGRAVFDVLIDHPDIIGRLDRGQTVGPAKANKAALAALFEVDEILVMDAIRNTAKEGQTAVNEFIGGKHALLSYRPSSPGLMTPSAGYTFSWTGRFGMSNEGTRIKRFRMDALESERVEVDSAYDQKLTGASLGCIFGDIVQ